MYFLAKYFKSSQTNKSVIQLLVSILDKIPVSITIGQIDKVCLYSWGKGEVKGKGGLDQGWIIGRVKFEAFLFESLANMVQSSK